MQRVYSVGWEVKTKILAALDDDELTTVTDINAIVCIDTAGLRKYLKAMMLDGFVIEARAPNPDKPGTKVNVYKAKNREGWEDYVLLEGGHDLRPENERKPKAKKSIPHRDTPFWGLVTNGYL